MSGPAVPGASGDAGVAAAPPEELSVAVSLGPVLAGLPVGAGLAGVEGVMVDGEADGDVAVLSGVVGSAVEAGPAADPAVTETDGDVVALAVRAPDDRAAWWVLAVPGLGVPLVVAAGEAALTDGEAELAVAASSCREA